MRQLNELCDLINDSCDPATSGASVYVGLEHIDSGAFRLKRHGSPADVRSTKSRFRKGDVLYGKLRPYLDKGVLAERDGICSTDILVFRPKLEVNPAYLLSLIHSEDFLNYSASTTHGVNHPRTSWASLAEFEWSVPEQQTRDKIAAVLWKVQQAIEVEERLIATARELKQSAMHQLFTRGLRGELQKETEIGLAPKSWNIASLGDLTVSSAFGPRFSAAKYSEAGAVTTLRTTDISNDGLIDWQHAPSANLNPADWASHFLELNDCVVTRSGTCGIVAVFNGHPKPVLPGAFLIRVRLGKRLLPEFFRYVANSYEGRSRMEQLAQGAIQKNISGTRLLTLQMPLPPIEEQSDIVGKLQMIDRKIFIHERKWAALRELFKTLLHKLMTGEISVADLDIDTSEVAAC